MKIKIDHHFLTTCHSVDDLFLGTSKISTFCGKLEKQSLANPEAYSPGMYVGDGFEFLVELLIKLSPVDNRIGIAEYFPIKVGNDNGVDGYGVNALGKKCAVQVKYRSNNNQFLTAGKDNLDSFMFESVLEGVLPETEGKCKNHYIFTTAQGLNHYTNNQKLRGSVKCIGFQELRELIDNNIHFWNFCRENILENLSEKKVKKMA